MDERLYALQDANWNITAITDANGDVQERYAYSPYGKPMFLSPTFTIRASSDFAWEALYAGYRYDAPTGLYAVRHRAYHPTLGVWLSRDPAEVGGQRSPFFPSDCTVTGCERIKCHAAKRL